MCERQHLSFGIWGITRLALLLMCCVTQASSFSSLEFNASSGKMLSWESGFFFYSDFFDKHLWSTYFVLYHYRSRATEVSKTNLGEGTLVSKKVISRCEV